MDAAVEAQSVTAAFFLFALAASGTADLQSILDKSLSAQDVPGISAIIVKDDDVLFAGAAGFADLQSATPMTTDTVFYIGSVSKVLTAVLTLQLAESGHFSLDAPVADVGFDLLPADAPISISQLLSHSSGLQREGDFGYWFTADFPDKAALDGYLNSTRLRIEPGKSARYSNIGFAVLGLLIEQITGKSYADALGESILEPLGMTSSGGRGPAPDPTTGYTPNDRILPTGTRPFAGIGERVGRRYERNYHDARAMSPAFGAYANAKDMGMLLRFLLGATGTNVLSADMRLRMFEPHASGWGLGLKIRNLDGRRVARHDGWFAAHRTHLILDTENSLGVVVLANSDNASPGDIAEALLAAALRHD